MLNVEYTSRFKKDLKLMKKRCKNLARLQMVMKKIENEIDLPQTLKNHTLRGNWNHHRELHLEPDWLFPQKLLCLAPPTDTIAFPFIIQNTLTTYLSHYIIRIILNGCQFLWKYNVT